MDKFAYKIEDKDVFEKALATGAYTGSQLDEKDGFIHLSTISQAQETLTCHFANRKNLIIAKIDIEPLGEKIIWEPSRGGELFPHIYGDLPANAVLKIWEIDCNNAVPKLPPEFFEGGKQ